MRNTAGGNRSRVDLIGLPDLAFAMAGGAHQLRCNAQHALTSSHKCALEALGDVPAVLDCPRDLLAEFVRPAQSFEVTLLGGGDLARRAPALCASTAARAWVRLWVSAPITIIQHVLSIEVSY